MGECLSTRRLKRLLGLCSLSKKQKQRNFAEKKLERNNKRERYYGEAGVGEMGMMVEKEVKQIKHSRENIILLNFGLLF